MCLAVASPTAAWHVTNEPKAVHACEDVLTALLDGALSDHTGDDESQQQLLPAALRMLHEHCTHGTRGVWANNTMVECDDFCGWPLDCCTAALAQLVLMQVTLRATSVSRECTEGAALLCVVYLTLLSHGCPAQNHA